MGGHENADVSGAAGAGVEVWEVASCFGVYHAVPGLFDYDSAGTRAHAWWWTGHLVEELEAVVLLFYHLRPG